MTPGHRVRKRLGEPRKEVQADTFVGAYTQAAKAQVADVIHGGDGLVPEIQNSRGMVIERFSGLCQPVFVPFRAVKERRLELPFKLA
jgi:hypothetical protein